MLSGHAITMFDNEAPRYGTHFRHFDYVNPDAPRGGSLRLAVEGTFDSFNPFIPQKGTLRVQAQSKRCSSTVLTNRSLPTA
ncbi:MAG: hypothetical protein CM1200mP20_16250 [Pseudomonadota bacterium]|nr:MAG: hypothetical protein CM1200mP20_16250 [Pseudomonadota bacterium]